MNRLYFGCQIRFILNYYPLFQVESENLEKCTRAPADDSDTEVNKYSSKCLYAMVFVFCVSNIQCPRASCYQSRDLNEVAIQSPSHSRAQTMPPLNSFLPTSAPSSMTRRQAKVVTSRLLDNVDTVPDQEDSLSLSEVNCHRVHTRSNTSLSIARNDSSRQSPELPAPPPCRPFSATSLSQKR